MPQPRYLVLLLLLLVLSGCGFHLRSAVELPPSMTRTYISAEPGSDLVYELESMLMAAGGEVVHERAAASAMLTLHQERLSSRILTLDAQGRASGRVLTLLVSFSMVDSEGRVVAEQEGVRIEREFNFDPDNVLARGGEESVLQEEMRRLAAQQILRRMRVLSQRVGTDVDATHEPNQEP